MDVNPLSHYLPSQSNRRKIYTIAIASGKGGVGKTSVAVNLSLSLCLLKQRTILFDGDMGLGNVTFMLGLKGVTANLEDVINGEKKLDEIMLEGPKGLKVIPAASGVEKLANLTTSESRRLWAQFEKIEAYGDFLVIDLGAGISETVLSFLLASESTIVLATPGKTAILDAYALIKVLHQRDPGCRLHLFINQYKEEIERVQTAAKLKNAAERFLNKQLIEVGAMKRDWRVDKALNTQEPFIIKYARAGVSKSMHDLAGYFISQAHGHKEPESRIKGLFKSAK